MSEDKKTQIEKKIVRKKSSKKMPKENSPENLVEKLKQASEGLFYISESDAAFEPFVWKREDKTLTEIKAEDVLKLAGQKETAKIQEKTLDEFFAQPTAIEDWFEDEEKAQVEKFVNLKNLLADNLKGVKVYKIGEVNIDIYIVGIDADGNLAGVKTSAVET